MTKNWLYISILFIGFLIGTPVITQAQYQDDFRLAEHYFKQGEFDKAADYYLKTYKKSKSLNHFDLYVKSLVSGKDYETAVKSLKKQIKKNPTRLTMLVQLGDVYWQMDDQKQAETTWDKVIDKLPESQHEIVPIAYKFTSLFQPEYALKAYEVGKLYVKGIQSYYLQIADLYGMVGDYGSMIDTYLELIEYNSGYLQTVQTYLNRNFDFTEDNENTRLLKQKLLQKVNKNPDEILYSEMLIWMNLQQSNFTGAFVQVKSLDRRFKENGSRLFSFAGLASKNYEHEIAKSAYQIVIDKGNDFPFYETAKVNILLVQKFKLNGDPLSTKEQYNKLIDQYLKTLNEFGIADFTAPMIRDMSSVYALKLQTPQESIQWLEKVLDSPGISKKETALTKIDLGDYLVMENKIWEAVLYYMQAEKAFKYDELGDEAKLRAAKVAYYTGDFAWAAAKLDVLKGSTSKLISNDALYLSNLITDNTTIDTNLHPMEMYARADLKYVQQDYTGALAILDSLQGFYPAHMVADEVLFQKAKIYRDMGEYQSAIDELQTLYLGYGYDILGDDAVYMQAHLFETYLNNPEKAMEYYLILMTEYPDSIFVTEARKRFRALRGDSV